MCFEEQRLWTVLFLIKILGFKTFPVPSHWVTILTFQSNKSALSSLLRIWVSPLPDLLNSSPFIFLSSAFAHYFSFYSSYLNYSFFFLSHSLYPLTLPFFLFYIWSFFTFCIRSLLLFCLIPLNSFFTLSFFLSLSLPLSLFLCPSFFLSLSFFLSFFLFYIGSFFLFCPTPFSSFSTRSLFLSFFYQSFYLPLFICISFPFLYTHLSYLSPSFSVPFTPSFARKREWKCNELSLSIAHAHF